MQGSGAWQGGWRALQRRDFGLVEHSRDRLAALNLKPVAREAAQQTGQVNGNREALKAADAKASRSHAKFKGLVGHT